MLKATVPFVEKEGVAPQEKVLGFSNKTGVKKITCPGARDKLNFRQDKHIFSPNIRRTSKKLNASIFFLDKDKLFGNRTSKNLDGLARGTSENFKIFLPL